MEWFVVRDGNTIGPMTLTDLVDAARHGELGKSDLVWHAVMKEWTPAISVPGLWSPPPLPDAGPVQPSITERPIEGIGEYHEGNDSHGRTTEGLRVAAKIGLSFLTVVVWALTRGFVKDPATAMYLGSVLAGVLAGSINMGMMILIYYIWTRPHKTGDES